MTLVAMVSAQDAMVEFLVPEAPVGQVSQGTKRVLPRRIASAITDVCAMTNEQDAGMADGGCSA